MYPPHPLIDAFQAIKKYLQILPNLVSNTRSSVANISKTKFVNSVFGMLGIKDYSKKDTNIMKYTFIKNLIQE